MGLLFTTSLGIAVACMLFRVSPWIWIIPLFVAVIFAFVFVVRHGDRVAVAAPAFSATKDGSHGLPNDAQSGIARLYLEKCLRSGPFSFSKAMIAPPGKTISRFTSWLPGTTYMCSGKMSASL